MRPIRRDDLEAAILADPDSREVYAVYADWLLEQGDPDGERSCAGSTATRWTRPSEVQISGQQLPEDGHRYVSISE